jgi:hypothetical protein
MGKCTVLIPFLCLGISFTGLSQRTLILGQNNYDQRREIIYEKEFTTDFRVHTGGAAVGINLGKIRSYNKTSLRYFGIGELKHPQEVKQNQNLPFGAGTGLRGYIFGKQNNLFALRGGIGEKRYLSEKARRKGVAIAVSYEAGPTIGVLKPYYLMLRTEPANFNQPNFRSERFSAENETRFLSVDKIFGADNFFQGIGALGFRPGVHAKFSAHADWGILDEFIKALEAGVMVDFFFQQVPIMAESTLVPNFKNQNVFINLFLTLQLGKRS